MRDIWLKRAYAVVPDHTASASNGKASASAALNARFQSVRARLHDLQLAEMLQTTPSDNIHVWMKPLPPPTTTSSSSSSAQPQSVSGSKPLNSFKVDEPDAALACHAAGASLYFRYAISSPAPLQLTTLCDASDSDSDCV